MILIHGQRLGFDTLVVFTPILKQVKIHHGSLKFRIRVLQFTAGTILVPQKAWCLLILRRLRIRWLHMNYATRRIDDFLLFVVANDLILVNTHALEILIYNDSPRIHARTISRAYTWTILTRYRHIIIFWFIRILIATLHVDVLFTREEWHDLHRRYHRLLDLHYVIAIVSVRVKRIIVEYIPLFL